MNDDLTKKERLWLLPASDKNKIAPGLYLIATPIGNLRDITIRALDTLEAADVVLCEDTRVTRKLLSYYGLKKKLVVYNDHNADKQRAHIFENLIADKIIALVSDAGTPLISDPGYKLACDALDKDFNVTTLPGPSASVSALLLSGMPSDRFSFIGFCPVKKGARDKVLEEWKSVATTIVAFETAPRLLSTLEGIRDVLGEREVAVVREITKLFEESRRGPVSQLIEHYSQEGPPKGEIVLVIEPGQMSVNHDEIAVMLKDALKTMSTKDAAAFVAEQTGQSKKDMYNLALSFSKE